MADKKGKSHGSSAMSDLKWFIAILIALWLLWFFTNGPARSKQEKPFIQPPTPVNTGVTTN